MNSILKVLYAVERPIGTEGVQSKFLHSVEDGSHYPYDSFPSGHAQGSSTLWAYLAFVVRHPLFLILVVGLIIGISTSRLYAGLHWPTDVLFGLIIGFGIALLGIYFQGIIARLPVKSHWLLAILAPILLIGVFPEEGMKYAGVLLGGGLGFLIEKKHVNMEINSSFIRKAVAFILGVIVLFALQVGLKLVFPAGALFDFLRYFILGVWIFLLAPLLFVARRIYRKTPQKVTYTMYH